MDSVVTRGVIENLMALHSAWPCSNNPSPEPTAPKPSLKTKDAEAEALFFAQLKFADELENKLPAKTASSLPKDIFTDSESESTSGSDDGLGASMAAARESAKASEPTLREPAEKGIPPKKIGAAAIIGMQNGRSWAAMTLSVMRLAEAGRSASTGEVITTVVLSAISVVAAIFNAVTATKNLADNEAEEEKLNSVLIRTKAQAATYFRNCETNQASSAAEAQAYGDFIAAASQHRKFSEKAVESTFLTRLTAAKEAAFVALAVLGLTQGILLVAGISVLVIGAALLTGLTVGLGLVANGYEIEQGRQGLVAADKRRKKSEETQNNLNKIFEQKNGSIDVNLANGIVSFYAKDAQKAEGEASFAFLRIAKGIVGMVVAGLGAAVIFMTGGALAPAAAALGAASSIPFFAGLGTKIYMDIKELKAAQNEKEAWLMLMNPEPDSPTQSEVGIDYGNRYIMVHQFAKALVDGPEIKKTSELEKILSAIGFTELEFNLLAGMQKMEGESNDKIHSITVILAKKMGIPL